MKKSMDPQTKINPSMEKCQSQLNKRMHNVDIDNVDKNVDFNNF